MQGFRFPNAPLAMQEKYSPA
ncbi:hypothetical protein PMI40_04022, partial [Herbaspirillum sp. YR522]